MADKRISQLNSHTTPSGSDLLVIVNNNETKKITYANLSAALTGSQTDISALNQFTQSIDGRVDNLESWSSSLDSTFATDLQVSIVSSSVAATIGVISQNTGLVTTASFNSFTQSIDSRVDGIENLTSSFATTGSNQFTGSQNISGSVVVDGTINASSVSATTLSTNGGYITNDSNDVLVGTDAILGYKILTNANTHTFHFDVDGNLSVPGNLIGATNFNTITNKPSLISGSSQLTASYDSRYVLSGSITQTTWDNISGKPDGLVSQSVSLSSLNAFTASYFTDSASIDGRVLTEKGRIDAILSASTANADTFAEIVTLINSVDTTNDNAFASYYTSSNARISSLENTTSSYETKGSDIVSGSSQLTSSLDLRYATSASYLTSLNGAFSSSIQTLGGSGVYSSSAQLPNGLVSGSSQLTSSYDTRYALSGSGGSTTIPAGTVSGSSQLTSSYDGRYTLTSSFNAFTASAQAVTTGSNSFNGTQTITGSLIITTGSFVGSQILANTSSLYLTSGSNMYVQNNGVVEITGSLKVSGSANFNVSVLSVDGRSGDEGGEINLAIPVTNTTLQNRVTTDIWQNRFRVFEGSANAKGVFVDLSKAPAGVGGELLWKASGIVNTGVDVILGDLKARIPSTGNKSLQLSTTSGVTYSVHGSGVYSQSGTVVGTTLSTALSVTSTPTYIVSGYNFGTAGATDTWVLMDTSNAIAWRITMIIGFAFNNNFISIERLH